MPNSPWSQQLQVHENQEPGKYDHSNIPSIFLARIPTFVANADASSMESTSQ